MNNEKIREIRINLLGGWLQECDTLDINTLREPFRSFVVSWCLQDYVFSKVVAFYLKRGRVPQPIGFLATVKRALRMVA